MRRELEKLNIDESPYEIVKREEICDYIDSIAKKMTNYSNNITKILEIQQKMNYKRKKIQLELNYKQNNKNNN